MTDHVRRDDLIVGGLALLLVLDLLILAWFSFGGTVTVGSTSISFGGSLTATDAPDGWLGVLAVISSLLILVDLRSSRSPHRRPFPRSVEAAPRPGSCSRSRPRCSWRSSSSSIWVTSATLGSASGSALVLVIALVYFAAAGAQRGPSRPGEHVRGAPDRDRRLPDRAGDNSPRMSSICRGCAAASGALAAGSVVLLARCCAAVVRRHADVTGWQSLITSGGWWS